MLFDDDCVAELPEGQDMTAEFCAVGRSDSVVKIEESTAEEDAVMKDGSSHKGSCSQSSQDDRDGNVGDAGSDGGWELRLLY